MKSKNYKVPRSNSKKIMPSELQPILWSKNIKALDFKKDKNYIIHQILSYGNLRQIRWLFKVYKREEIKNAFLKFPKKVYQPAIFYFIKKFVLNLRKKQLKEEKYVKTTF